MKGKSIFSEINRRYAKPRIQTTQAVKIALLGLRIYLLTLVGLLLVTFILVANHIK